MYLMAEAAIKAKLRFLLASGHLYSATAPATSAQLILQHHTEISGTAGIKSSDGSSSSCRACGTVLIVGWTSQLSRVDKPSSLTANPKPGSKKRRTSVHPEKYVRIKCLACHRFEDTPLQKTRTSRINGRDKATLQATSSTDAMTNPDPDVCPLEKSTKAGRRREKARKNKSGLQAMLDKS